MSKYTGILVVAFVLVAGIAAASSLYARDNHESSGSMMEQERGRDRTTGRGGMMKEMSQMMDRCSQMMGNGGSNRPNDQWRQRQ